MRCRMAFEADPQDHYPALAVIEKCCVLSCHGRAAGTAVVLRSPERLGRVQKFQDWFMRGVRGHSGASVLAPEYRRPLGAFWAVLLI